jgi:hypothetical protein
MAREELSLCRMYIGPNMLGEEPWNTVEGEPAKVCALRHLGRANALREFAQRQPAWPPWCGCGDELGPLTRSRVDPTRCTSCEPWVHEPRQST